MIWIKSMYIGLYKTPNKALSCLVLSCLVYHLPPPAPLWNEKGTGAEMRRAIVTGIPTGDVSVSYWPIFFPFSRKSFGPVSSLLKRPMTGQVCNFVSSFILILWDRFFPVRSWRQRAWKGTDFKLTASFIEFQLSMQYLVLYNPSFRS